MPESSEHENGKTEEYERLIKPGDAVETPDGELWVVTSRGLFGEVPGLGLTSAYRGTEGRVYADPVEPIETNVPADMVTKIADARQVRW